MARRRRRSRSGKGSGVVILLGLMLVVVLAAAAYWLVLAPYGPSEEKFVTIAPHSSTPAIGRKLEEAGIVRSRYGIDLLRLVQHGKLQAGAYRFDHPASALEVYRRIARGDVFTKAVTVPEGANIFDIAARVEQAGLCSSKDFLVATYSQTSLIADLDPEATSLEGYLFPDTYRFPPTDTPEQMVAAMVRRFRQVAAQQGLKENMHRTITLASLVERETAVASDRPLVASVFENRLAQKIPLRTDPAVIYGLVRIGQWQGAIHQSDLSHDTPYNTYLHGGLPPGPIANPGIPSLRAAMNPPKTNYLYFVAASTDAQGHSLFATTLDEHNHNVATYRRAQKKAGER